MSDVRLFPVPLDLTDDQLADIGAVYSAKDLSLGIDDTKDLILISNSDVNLCAQNVLRLLLTEKGSVPSEPNTGSNLLKLTRGYDPSTLTEDISLILYDVERQCTRNDVLASNSLSVQLANIELLDLKLYNSSELVITIGIRTVSGDTATLRLQV